MSTQKKITYKKSGVDVAKGDKLVEKIKPIAKATFRKEVINEIGGFSSLMSIPKKYKNPVLVSSTDGVGTKIEIAEMMNNHTTIGIDLVAMCVNDLITSGAEPLFFLDYLVTDKINLQKSKEIISGIANGCRESNCSLIGGETAEHPKNFPKGKYDLAGFSVGIIEKENLKKKKLRSGDILVGLKSSGLHSNGFSLVRELIKRKKISLNGKFGSSPLGQTLLKPTKLYVNEILKLSNKVKIKNMAHITGGGLIGNLERIVPNTYSFELSRKDLFFFHKKLFSYLKEKSALTDIEMLRTFNCGYGMVIIIDQEDLKKTIINLNKLKQKFRVLGNVTRKTKEPKIKFI